jgi:hypothetical protein
LCAVRRGFGTDAVFAATGFEGCASDGSPFGSTSAGRSTYFGVSLAAGASPVVSAGAAVSEAFGVSLTCADALPAGAVAAEVSLPDTDKLLSPACAVAEAKTIAVIRMNARIVVSPRW